MTTTTLAIAGHPFGNPFILAPMAGVSEMPFRVLARAMGAGAAPTELVSASGLLYGQARTMRYMEHDRALEQPFWVQLFGGDPQAMAAGAVRAAELGARIIDINMGCPVRKVTRHGAGSGLLCDPTRAAAIVAAVARASGLPVTAKLRAGWDHASLNYRDVAAALQDAGVAGLALHARTRAQGYSGSAEWSWIADLVAHTTVPVIGNGDVRSAADAHRMLAETGCAGVMIGRAALGNPWIFAALRGERGQPTPAERWRQVRAHLQAHVAFVGDAGRALRRFRGHLMWYAHGLAQAAAFRREVCTCDDLQRMMAIAEDFFLAADGDPEAEAGGQAFDERTALG